MNLLPGRTALMAPVLALALALAINPGTMIAQTGSSAGSVDSAQVALGKKLFESKGLCFSCHGKGGEGLLGPTTKLAGRKFTHTDGSVGALVALIKAGIAAEQSTSKQVMPPKGGSRLTDPEVEAVARYVRKLNAASSKICN